MNNDLISEANLTIDYLKEIIGGIGMETRVDDEGCLFVDNETTILVYPDEDGETVELITVYNFKAATTELERLRAANRINEQIGVIRATADKDYCLVIGWNIPVQGGISIPTFVYALETFFALQPLILEEVQVLLE